MRLVYDYRDYRGFLRDYYLSQKERNRSFSYTVFARQLGLSSAAHVQLILSGKRNLTVHSIHVLAAALALSGPELEYFEALVHANQAETASERRYYERRLELLGERKPKSSSRLKTSYLLCHGLLPALLVSIDGKSLSDAESAGSHFGYSPEETQRILQQLLKEGVIGLLHAGEAAERVQLSQRHLILHDRKTRSQAQKEFLLKQLRLSGRAFETMYEERAKFFAHTFTVSQAQASVYEDEVKKLIERVTRLSDEQPSDAVMQLNIQLFPYAKSLLLR